jgi:phosphate acyltransferase
MKNITLSLDVSGGDFGAPVVLPGAALALSRNANLRFILVGNQAEIEAGLVALPKLAAVSEIIHTDVAIAMSDKPSVALRKGRKVSSMWRAIDMVKEGRAGACISAGNTGALMAMSAFNLKMRDGVERPSIAGLWPTVRGRSVVLDMGATIGATGKDLYTMGLMGAAMAKILLGVENPSVGLLNIGTEEMKGLEFIKEASELMKASSLNYYGFVEGTDLGKGVTDVVVTEGFTGNIALKTAEGTAKQIGEYFKAAFSSSFLTKIAYLLAKSALQTVRDKTDARKVNGGVFLGLNGIVIKSHGGTDAEGFANAIEVGVKMVQEDLTNKISLLLLKEK